MNLRARFLDLQSLLTRLDSLWRPAPFHVARPQWCTQWPGLAAALEALDDQHVEQLGEDFEACATWLTSHLPELARLVEALARHFGRLEGAVSSVHTAVQIFMPESL